MDCEAGSGIKNFGCLISGSGFGLTGSGAEGCGDPYRFRRPRQVPAHLGLTPRKYASGEVDYNGGITKCGDAMLRSHLFEVASLLIMQRAKKNALKSLGLRVAKKGSKKKAMIAVARKLSIIMHRIWLDGTEFNSEEQEKIAA